ncbi:MAG: sensor domain-containing diguanylate cyclase [Thermotoga caldifontis]|uniref:sensor domain-containing diguanylate cyclase n=1 Tax=Thermotoga caldifontis TaxID=1508419 RepID=UPI003C7BF48C
MSADLEACVEVFREIGAIASMLLSEQTEDVYQQILERSIKIVPGAQAGSVLVRENNRFKHVAAAGYDLEQLKKISFSVEEEEFWAGKDKDHVILVRDNVIAFNETIVKDERLEVLKEAGSLRKVKSTLVIPVRVKGELRLVLNLDNFESSEAFDSNSVIIAKVLANMLATIFKRLELEKELMEKNRLLEYMSYHDVLTGLANRRMFEEFAEKMLLLAKREEKTLSVLFLDLDKFKSVNDLYGHHTGDEVLKRVACRLERCVRASDMVSKFGGDEFVILAYDCSKPKAKLLAERLIKAVEEPIKVGDLTFELSASVGVATFPEDGGELAELIRLSDERLYMAKKGRSKIVVSG